jgi:Lon protease-like protein
MDILDKLFEPQYFYVVRDAMGKHVDMGYVAVSRVQERAGKAQRAGCSIMLMIPNNTCH